MATERKSGMLALFHCWDFSIDPFHMFDLMLVCVIRMQEDSDTKDLNHGQTTTQT